VESERVGEYLIRRLTELGIRHIFGIPGDYVLGFYDLLSRSADLEVINTSDEQGAGFAADAYARVKGLGAVCVTYGVGALKIANTTAQAYAEKSPVVVISGAPGIAEQQQRQLLHHQITDYGMQKRVFEEFTVAATVIDTPETAREEIDRVLAAALHFKRPVYIELPRDQVFALCPPQRKPPIKKEKSDPAALQEAIEEAVGLINAARQPVILAGVEIHRFGLQKELCQLARAKGIPAAATILAKSVIADTEKFYMGIYEGATGLEEVRSYVESSDCLLLLGAFLTDMDLGLFTANIDPSTSIYATSERISIRHHRFDSVLFHDFIKGLLKAAIVPRKLQGTPHPRAPKPFLHGSDKKITVASLFEQVNAFLDTTTMVVADIGDALFGANDLYLHHSTSFLSPAFYASLGFAVPGALGAQLASPKVRPLVLVGDGAFQMTGMEISTIARCGLNPIIIVLNNQGYSTERPMLDGPYNDVHPWHFSKIPSVIGTGIGFIVETEADLEQALLTARKNTDSFTIIDVKLDKHDRSPALTRLTKKLGEKVQSAPSGRTTSHGGNKQH